MKRFRNALCAIWLCGWVGISNRSALAQQRVSLADLSAFQSPAPSWTLAAAAQADLAQTGNLSTSPGTGVLVNTPGNSTPGNALVTRKSYGDLTLEFDFMPAKDTRSAVYMQERYAVQLVDSWGKPDPTAQDNGGVTAGLADSTQPGPEAAGKGYAPRQSVSRAPGLWQHLLVAFQAPRFDSTGHKTANAKLLRVELNGVLIHENIDLISPNPAALSEVPFAPLSFRSSRGPVAFRNIVLTEYNQPSPVLDRLAYTVYKGSLPTRPDFRQLTAAAKGVLPVLTSQLSALPAQFLLRYTGLLHVTEAGRYTFKLTTPGGTGQLSLNDRPVLDWGSPGGTAVADLPAGDFPFDLQYAKREGWEKSPLLLTVSSPGLRQTDLTDANDQLTMLVNPILVDETTTSLLRSFVDLPDYGRVVHAISVGSPNHLHYTYDTDFGNVVQVWRGDFLDATPMWHGRGDGSARPIGSVLTLGKPALAVARLSSAQAVWPADTAGSGYRIKGYNLDTEGLPTFHFRLGSSVVSDIIRVMDGGKEIHRELSVDSPLPDLYSRLAVAPSITPLPNGLYVVSDYAYYLRIDEPAGAKPMLRTTASGQELLLPLRQKMSYTLFY